MPTVVVEYLNLMGDSLIDPPTTSIAEEIF